MAHTNEYLIKQLMRVQLEDYNASWDWKNDAPVPTKSPEIFEIDGAVAVSCEHGDSAGDYYGEYRGGDSWINPAILAAAEKAGFYAEWYNPGCYVFYAE
jgi:hypothetical protein